MASDRLLAYSQWYEGGRQRGMGHRQAMDRALGILGLPEEEANALLWGLECEGDATEYIEILCKGDPAPAFRINGSYHCGACGSSTTLHRTPLAALIDSRVRPAPVEAENGSQGLPASRVHVFEPSGSSRDQPAEPT